MSKPPATSKRNNTQRVHNPGKHVMASTARSEVGGLFHNAKTAVPLQITHHELGFPLSPTPIKTDNSSAKVISTDTVIQKCSRSMDIRFYWMKDRVKQRNLFLIGEQEVKIWGITSWNITHHITIDKFVLLICVWKINYLKWTKRWCNNGWMLYPRQTIQFYS